MNEGGECVKGMAFETSWSLNDGEADRCVVWGVSK